MGSFGERLRREREMRGITIEEIAEATKIGTRNLRALEEEHFGLLPGGIFNKGFVRAYSKYLGLDEEQAVADYIAAETSFREASSDGLDVPVESSPRVSLALPLTIVLALAIGGAGFGGWKYHQKRVAQRQAEQAAIAQRSAQPATISAPVVPPAAAAVQPAADSASAAQPTAGSPASAPAATSTDSAVSSPAAATESLFADGFVVQLKAMEDSWVSAKADGRSVLSETLKARNEKTLRARDRIVLTLGNAGGVQISYNGKDLNLGNASGQVKTLVFTARGLQPEVPEQRR